MARTAIVVDDHGPTRALVRRMLEKAGVDVIGEAGDAAGALAAVARLRPEVLVLDVQLPDGSGIDVARTVRAGPAPPRVVLISSVDYATAAARCGAQAFVRKDQLSVDALEAAVAP